MRKILSMASNTSREMSKVMGFWLVRVIQETQGTRKGSRSTLWPKKDVREKK